MKHSLEVPADCPNPDRKIHHDDLKGMSMTSRPIPTEAILGCSFEEANAYWGQKPTRRHHRDHICPLSQARSEEERVKLCHYWNIQWLSAREDAAKSNHWTQAGAELCEILLGRPWQEITRKTNMPPNPTAQESPPRP